MKKTDIKIRQAKYDLDNMVVMANDMIKGISKLSLNEAKLLRTIIMQIKPYDEELEVFTVKADEFAAILGIDKNHIYAEIDKMTDHLLDEKIRIGDKTTKKKSKWKKFRWVDYCEYDTGTLTIKLSDQLRPYLLGLQKWYTQYRLEDIIFFKSWYSIRIYELLMMCIDERKKPYADKIVDIYMSLKDLRTYTETEKKYARLSQFKAKVLNIAVRDINEWSAYHVTVREYKEKKKIVGFYFSVGSKIGYNYKNISEELPEHVEQMNLFDMMDGEKS